MKCIIFFSFLSSLCLCLGQDNREGNNASNLNGEDSRYPYLSYGFLIEELNGTRTDIQNVIITVETNLLMDTTRIFQEADKVCDMAQAQPTGVTIYTIPLRNGQNLTTIYCNLYVSYMFVARAVDNKEARARFGANGLKASLAQLTQFLLYQPRDPAKSRNRPFRGDTCKTSIATHESTSQQSNGQTSFPKVCTNEEQGQLTLAQRMVKHVAYAFREANMFRSQLELGVLLMRGD